MTLLMDFSLSLCVWTLTASLKVEYFSDSELDGGQRRISVMAGLSCSDKLTSPAPISSPPLWKVSWRESCSFVQLSWKSRSYLQSQSPQYVLPVRGETQGVYVLVLCLSLPVPLCPSVFFLSVFFLPNWT